MDNQQLQAWVEKISLQSFGRPFLHKATFNSRLTSTGGRYFTKSHHIDISSKQYELFGEAEVEKIIKHELCHYHLHLLKKGYQHRDRDFKQLLKQVGGTRFCQTVKPQKRTQPHRYRLLCTKCGMAYLRKRRMDPSRYACGRCKGKLVLQELSSILTSNPNHDKL
jgi:SprT-like protein